MKTEYHRSTDQRPFVAARECILQSAIFIGAAGEVSRATYGKVGAK